LSFKAALIDFGDTLAYLDEVENRRYKETLVATLMKHGYERHLRDLDSALASIYVSSTKGELKTLQEFWSLVLRKLRIPELPELIDDMENVRNNYSTAVWKLYDGVFAALTILKRKYKLALVSNCSVGTDELIASLGLARFFSCIILSYKVGVRKPDKRMYLEALGCLGLEARECVFVADEISDLEGAREIGLQTMLVKQGSSTFQEAKDLDFRPDFQINRISDIIKFL
jgi:HAD superfamily hydrolase (TIGR01509 family)